MIVGVTTPTRTPLNFDGSAARVAAGAEHLALGVGSDFRLHISPTPLVFDRADGAYLYDVDGQRLIDYYLGMGPMVLGHTPSQVIAAVREQVGRSILPAGQTEAEYEAARLVCEMVPCAEVVRFGSSGSEVVQAALRLARDATQRRTVVKFEGHYHGWFDNVLWSHAPSADALGPVEDPNLVPGSAGQEQQAGDGLDVLPWNDLPRLEERLARGDVAAVIMEPVMCNTSAVWPESGYVEGVRAACDRTGTLLVFDEVITGFRLSPGGAQQVLGVTPDLAVFGKAIASGFPVGALAGRRDLMERFGAGGKVMHAGTYNGQPVAMAATVAAVRVLQQPETHPRIAATGQRLMDGLTHAFDTAGVDAVVQGHPSVFHVGLGRTEPIRSYRDSLTTDKAAYVKLTTALLSRGVRALERGAWFVSTAHTEADVDETIAAVEDALAAGALS